MERLKKREAEAASVDLDSYDRLAEEIASGDSDGDEETVESVLAAADGSIDDLRDEVKRVQEREELLIVARDFEAAAASYRESSAAIEELRIARDDGFFDNTEWQSLHNEHRAARGRLEQCKRARDPLWVIRDRHVDEQYRALCDQERDTGQAGFDARVALEKVREKLVRIPGGLCRKKVSTNA